jgi:hypothetical protein
MRTGNCTAFINNRIRLGKLVMNDTELILIDVEPNGPLDFFLDHYKEQLSAGYSELTPDSGLRVYIKDSNKLHSEKSSPGDYKRSEVEVRNLSAHCMAELDVSLLIAGLD